MNRIKTVFFGTQNFAAVILQKLLQADFIELTGVVTQPDRAVGREQKISFSPVKNLAIANALPIFQPETLKEFPPDNLPAADLYIVCQYGLIIPKIIVDHPRLGSINVHGSILPKYRGASPIQAALINGEKETGVTIMLMDEKMDHGPILSTKTMIIDENENAGQLSERMAVIGAELLMETLPKYFNGEIKPVIQSGEPTFCKLLSRDDGHVNFTLSNEAVYNLYRGLHPWPGIWTTWNGKRIKLLEITNNDKTIASGIVSLENGHVYIGCSSGSIDVISLQPEGKKPMNAKAFGNGFKNINGAHLE